MDQRWTIRLVVVLVVAVIVASAGRLPRPRKPSTLSRTRREFPVDAIRSDLGSANKNDRDLNVVIATIIDVKDFVRLVNSIASNQSNDVVDVNASDGSRKKQNCPGSCSSMKNNPDDTNSNEIIFGNRKITNPDFETTIFDVADKSGRQRNNLNVVFRHFDEVVGKVLREILTDLENRPNEGQIYRRPDVRRRVGLISKIVEVMKDALTMLEGRFGGKKTNVAVTTDSTDGDSFGRLSGFDDEDETLSALYEETKMVRRLILDYYDLWDRRSGDEEASKKDESSDDLNEAFRIFMNPSRGSKITDRLKNYAKTMLNRIVSIAKSGNGDIVDCPKPKAKNEKDENKENSTDAKGEKNRDDSEEPKEERLPLEGKEKDPKVETTTSVEVTSTTDRGPKVEEIISRQSTTTDRLNDEDENKNVGGVEATTVKDTEEVSQGLPAVNDLIENLEEEKTATEIIVDRPSPQSSSSQVDQNVSTTIPVAENDSNEYSTTVKQIEEKINEEANTTDSITDRAVTETREMENKNDDTTNSSIDTTVIRENKVKIESNETIDVSMKNAITEDNEDTSDKIATTEKSIDEISNEANEEITERSETINNNVNNNSSTTELVTEKNYEIIENTTDLSSLEVKNSSLREYEKNSDGNSTKATRLENSELTDVVDEDKLGNSMNDSLDTNINFINSNSNLVILQLRPRTNETVSDDAPETSDVGTSMRFGPGDLSNTRIEKIVNGSADVAETNELPDPESETNVPNSSTTPSGSDPPPETEISAEERSISNETTTRIDIATNDSEIGDRNNDVVDAERTKNFGRHFNDVSRPTAMPEKSSDGNLSRRNDNDEREKKRYIMDIILESINAIMADNGTQWAKPTNDGKSLRSCLLTWILSKLSC